MGRTTVFRHTEKIKVDSVPFSENLLKAAFLVLTHVNGHMMIKMRIFLNIFSVYECPQPKSFTSHQGALKSNSYTTYANIIYYTRMLNVMGNVFYPTTAGCFSNEGLGNADSNDVESAWSSHVPARSVASPLGLACAHT